jgi:Cu-Zn family superoxide dismutase
MKKWILSIALVIFIMTTSACSGKNDSLSTQKSTAETMTVSKSSLSPIKVKMINTKGKNIGEAMLSEDSKGVKIVLTAEGLKPGFTAIHIHEIGKCEVPDFKTASGHFNPGHKEHGFNNPNGFHAGDLPNIEVSQTGKVSAEIHAMEFTLKQGEKNSLLDEDGSAIVIHEKRDDYKTDPTGNSGNRMACGVISN